MYGSHMVEQEYGGNVDLFSKPEVTHCHKSDPETSRVAAGKVKITKQAAEVLRDCLAYPFQDRGFTTKELAVHTRKDRMMYVRRFSDLKALGKIKETGDIREKCAVFRAA